jgi:murein L,D-transpeptidase YafK
MSAGPGPGRATRRATLRASLLVSLLAAGLLWDRLAQITAVPRAPLAAPVDRLLVEKGARRLTVFRDGAALRVYPVTLGFEPQGPKLRQGDGRTPEGLFRIDRKNAASRFHLALGLDYPRAEDRARAAAAGVAPGGDIFIHGQPGGLGPRERLTTDWTAGCIAVSNAVMDELWPAVGLGTEIEVRP